jgi:predicted PurR-regulated permease PerM
MPKPREWADSRPENSRPEKTQAEPATPQNGADEKPMINREVVTSAAVIGLAMFALVAALYIAKPFFLPIVMAFIVGTMLSPAAGFLEKRGVPRPMSALLIVTLALAGASFIVGLISSPLVAWSGRLPELGQLLREKLHAFDRPIALWRQLQSSLGGTDALAPTTIQMPQIDWMQPTVEFLSPTFTEILLFLATLVLFIAGWRDLRRALVMTFTSRDVRLRTLRILNEVETSLGGYLLTVTSINFGYGAATGVICALAGMPNPAGLGALAAVLNFFPIIGPFAMFVILTVVGIISLPSLGAGLIAPAAFVGLTFIEGHFITPIIIGRRLSLNTLAVFIALAFWTWLWGPMGGFLSSPLLIVALIAKEHLMPDDSPQLPGD